VKRVTINVVHEGLTMYELGSFDINDTMAKTISAHSTMAAQLQAAMRELELLSGDRAEITEAIRSRDDAIAALEAKLAAAEARIGRLQALELARREKDELVKQVPFYDPAAIQEINGAIHGHKVLCDIHNDLTPPQAEGASDAQP